MKPFLPEGQNVIIFTATLLLFLLLPSASNVSILGMTSAWRHTTQTRDSVTAYIQVIKGVGFVNKCLSRNWSAVNEGVGLYGARRTRPTFSETYINYSQRFFHFALYIACRRSYLRSPLNSGECLP